MTDEDRVADMEATCRGVACALSLLASGIEAERVADSRIPEALRVLEGALEGCIGETASGSLTHRDR